MVQSKNAKCECDLSTVIPMAEWLEQEKDGECRPCSIAALVGEYQKALNSNGQKDLADRFTSLLGSESDDVVLDIAKLMDEAKKLAPEPVKETLVMLDCMAQTSQQ
jgi:hypothetical protein